MVIEKLKSDEIPSLIKLYRSSINCDESDAISGEIYREMIKDDKCTILVAKENNEIVGSVVCACCKALEDDADSFLVIESPIVMCGKDKCAIGEKLIKASDQFARTKDCTYGIVISFDNKKETCKFYENIGFTGSVRGFRKKYK